jgi:hypothetical protein
MVHRALLVAKAVGSDHSNRLHGFRISDRGLDIENSIACDHLSGMCAAGQPLTASGALPAAP